MSTKDYNEGYADGFKEGIEAARKIDKDADKLFRPLREAIRGIRN